MQLLEYTFPRECCRCNLEAATTFWPISGDFFSVQTSGFFSTRKREQKTVRVPVCESCFKFLQTHKNEKEPAYFRDEKLAFYLEDYQRKFAAINPGK